MRSRLRRLIIAAAAIGSAAAVYAGWTDKHLHTHHPPDLSRKYYLIHQDSITASLDSLFRFKAPHDMVVEYVSAVVRNMTGTITQATIELYDADLRVLHHAVDLYDAALTSAGEFQEGVFMDPARPLFVKSGNVFRGSVFLDGTGTPTLNDLCVEIVYRAPGGEEK
jgi:hypothetical protein